MNIENISDLTDMENKVNNFVGTKDGYEKKHKILKKLSKEIYEVSPEKHEFMAGWIAWSLNEGLISNADVQYQIKDTIIRYNQQKELKIVEELLSPRLEELNQKLKNGEIGVSQFVKLKASIEEPLKSLEDTFDKDNRQRWIDYDLTVQREDETYQQFKKRQEFYNKACAKAEEREKEKKEERARYKKEDITTYSVWIKNIDEIRQFIKMMYDKIIESKYTLPGVSSSDLTEFIDEFMELDINKVMDSPNALHDFPEFIPQTNKIIKPLLLTCDAGDEEYPICYIFGWLINAFNNILGSFYHNSNGLINSGAECNASQYYGLFSDNKEMFLEKLQKIKKNRRKGILTKKKKRSKC